MLPKINAQRGEIHLITRDYKWHFVVNQPFAVVGGDPFPHINNVSIPSALDLVQMLADDSRRLLLLRKVQHQQAGCVQQFYFEKGIEIPEKKW